MLEISFRPGESPSSVKSSVKTAAKRARVRVQIAIREPRMYLWIPGKRPKTIQLRTRDPIPCPVCGMPIIRPKYGASKQFVHAGKGKKKSECQKTWRYAKAHGISISEAIERRRRLKRG